MLKQTILTAALIFLSASFSDGGILPAHFLDNENLDLFCLRLSYPAIKNVNRDDAGKIRLLLQNGMQVPYTGNNDNSSLNADIKNSMLQMYPLEPVRPDTGPGFAPGRKRPYDLFFALYGQNAASVSKGLESARFNGATLNLQKQAAIAFAKATPKLEALRKRENMKKFLKPDGAFYWRKIAGEPWLSAHSFGIALDFGANSAPYWRWQKKMPHPLQKDYPAEIVRTMENHGFIWGGKWHEYDLMHFEYRPELLCKARMAKYMRRNGKASIQLKPDYGKSGSAY